MIKDYCFMFHVEAFQICVNRDPLFNRVLSWTYYVAILKCKKMR